MKDIFVFGSNLAGVHGSGAAAEARARGFPMGLGVGFSTRCYALPTKDCDIVTLPLEIVKLYAVQFRVFASERLLHYPDDRFQVTRVGCGLAGFKDSEIAPLFASAPSNCLFDEAWRPWLDGYGAASYWGTFA